MKIREFIKENEVDIKDLLKLGISEFCKDQIYFPCNGEVEKFAEKFIENITKEEEV